MKHSLEYLPVSFMIALSAISIWSGRREEARRICSDGVVRCGCHLKPLSEDQQRLQVLEAEVELRRLRDRVRKAVTRYTVDSNGDRPVKRSRLHKQPVLDTLIEVQWNVTAAQLAEHLCYWRHTSALAVVHLTDCLKELTPRSQEPPESKRALTLVWWDMEDEIERALSYRRQDPDQAMADGKDVVHVTVGDIVPLFVWEADLLRTRPETRAVCSRMLDFDFMDYKRRCGVLAPAMVEYLRHHGPLFHTEFGLRVCLCRGCEFKKIAESNADLEAMLPRPAIPQAQQAASAAPCSSVMLHPIRRRRLDESLITELDDNVNTSQADSNDEVRSVEQDDCMA